MNEFNERSQLHGYWELYWPNGNIWCRGNYINDKKNGYWQFMSYNGEISYKEFYL